MNPNNTGSFGAAIGGMSPELQAAVQRRAGGNPSGTMGQTSNTAPTNNPQTQIPPSSPAPNPSPPNPVSVGMGGGAGLPSGSDESSLIVKALTGRLQSLSKIQGA